MSVPRRPIARSRHEFLQKSRERKRKQRLWRLVVLGVLGVVVLVGGVILTRLERFQIAAVSIAGATEVPVMPLQTTVEEMLAGHYAWLLPRSNLWFLPREHIVEQLERQFPAVAAANLAVAADHTLRVTVTERQAVATVCPHGSEAEVECYSIDASGTLFSPVKTTTSENFVWYVSMPTTPALGNTMFDSSDWANMVALPEQLVGALAGTVLSNYRATTATAEMAGDYRVRLEHGGDIISLLINAHNSSAIALDNLHSALVSTIFLKAWEGNKAGLEYLDVRFPPKVFYKFK